MGNFQKAFLVAFSTILFLGFWLPAAPQPSPPAQSAVSQKSSVLSSSAEAPQIPAQANSACLPGTPCVNTAELEKEMYQLVNEDRLDPQNLAETGGRTLPLRWDPKMALAARAHSEGMALRRSLGHYDPNGDSPVERIYHAGVRWVAMGENVAQNLTVAAAESALMNEPRFKVNHRGNILNKNFNSIGIGIAVSADGQLYITQDFAEEPQQASLAGMGN
jgi:uncharacterized protein YkwD